MRFHVDERIRNNIRHTKCIGLSCLVFCLYLLFGSVAVEFACRYGMVFIMSIFEVDKFKNGLTILVEGSVALKWIRKRQKQKRWKIIERRRKWNKSLWPIRNLWDVRYFDRCSPPPVCVILHSFLPHFTLNYFSHSKCTPHFSHYIFSPSFSRF